MPVQEQLYSFETVLSILAKLYLHAPLPVARLCDDELDRSGALLGKVRSCARALLTPDKRRED